MTEAQGYASKGVLREKVDCPVCHRRMALRTWNYRHVRKRPPSEADVDAQRSKKTRTATEALQRRLADREGQGPATE